MSPTRYFISTDKSVDYIFISTSEGKAMKYTKDGKWMRINNITTNDLTMLSIEGKFTEISAAEVLDLISKACQGL